VVRGVQSFLDSPSKNLLGHFYKFLDISSESSAQAQSIGTLFGQIGLRAGSVTDMSNSQRHARLGVGRGVIKLMEQRFTLNLQELCQHETVSGVLKKWNQCGTVQASCGCLVGHLCMGI